MIAGQYLPPPPRKLWATIWTGDRDTVAGTSGANEFWAWLGPIDPAHRGRGVVHSHPPFVAIHDAPKWSYAAVRLAFWRPLDRLIHTVLPGTPGV